MNSNKRKVEVFKTNCPSCDPVVDMVQSVACGSCDVTVYNVEDSCDSKECSTKVHEYGIKKFPAVAVDGKLLSCCEDVGLTRESLQNAGIGVE
jgi:hypothetical protein